MHSSLAPIVLFVYNRLDHTRQTLAALQANTLAKGSDLFIYADAAKNEAAMPTVAAVRDFVRSISGFASVTVIERDRNWGLADSIVDGVTTVVEKYGRVIVLEDDIVTSPHFLTYMNQALSLYDNDEQVLHVSGYFYPVDPSDLPETFFYNQASCWGWGTWARAWAKLETNVDVLLRQLKNVPSDNEYRRSTESQLQANRDGRIKTWAARWHASILINGGYCLHPRQSLVQNIGHDGSGVHSQENELLGAPLPPLSNPPQLAKYTEHAEHPLAVARANAFARTLVPPLWQRLANRLRTFLQAK